MLFKKIVVGLVLCSLWWSAAACAAPATPTDLPPQRVITAGFTPASKCRVPDIVGLNQAAAQSMLAELGLQPVWSKKFDANIAAGAVISVDPLANTLLEPCGGPVDVVVSMGPVPQPTKPPEPTPTPTLAPSATPSPVPSATPVPTATVPATVTPTLDGNLPTGEWAVKTYLTDDTNLILVNGHIVGVSSYRKESNWININSFFKSSGPNYVTFINLNGPSGGSWGFSVRQNGVIVWGNEGSTEKSNTLGYIQTLQILGSGVVKEVNLKNTSKQKLAGSWTARAVAEDAGLLLVNGVPVTGSLAMWDFNWVDISGMLYANENNVISAVVWNISDTYAWDFSVRKGQTIVWGAQDKGSGQTGEVLFISVTIDGVGNVIRP